MHVRYAPKKVSAELFDMLRQACTGDALTCVRAVNDMRGLTAWLRQWRGRFVWLEQSGARKKSKS